MDSYICWTKHGERGLVMEDGDDEQDDNHIPDAAAYYGAFGDDVRMGEVDHENVADEGVEEEVAEDGEPDELGQMLYDEERECESEKVRKKLQRMLQDHKTLLYPDCNKEHKKLDNTLTLLQWRASNGVLDKGFEQLLKILKKLLPANNKLPNTTYEVRQMVCALGLEL